MQFQLFRIADVWCTGPTVYKDELKEDRWYGFFTSSIDIIEKDYDRDFYLYDREGQKTENFINFNVFNILKL